MALPDGLLHYVAIAAAFSLTEQRVPWEQGLAWLNAHGLASGTRADLELVLNKVLLNYWVSEQPYPERQMTEA